MAIFALLSFSVLLLIFALAFRKKHIKGYNSMMRHNKNVQPLFKERSANIKYDELLELFNTRPGALRELIKLRDNYTDSVITAAQYETALDELAKKYKS